MPIAWWHSTPRTAEAVSNSPCPKFSLHFGRKLFTFLSGTQFAEDMDDAIERLEPAISRAHADLARHLDRDSWPCPSTPKTTRWAISSMS